MILIIVSFMFIYPRTIVIISQQENDDEQDPTVSNLSTNTCSLHNPMATTGKVPHFCNF